MVVLTLGIMLLRLGSLFSECRWRPRCHVSPITGPQHPRIWIPVMCHPMAVCDRTSWALLLWFTPFHCWKAEQMLLSMSPVRWGGKKGLLARASHLWPTGSPVPSSYSLLALLTAPQRLACCAQKNTNVTSAFGILFYLKSFLFLNKTSHSWILTLLIG